MEHENPCNRTISLTKAAATPVAVKGCLRGMKWAYLLNLSTTMSRESNTPDFGSPSIKSIDILPSQICCGMGSDCRSHAGDNAIFWSSRQTGHSSTNFLMFAFIPLQYRLLASLLYVRRNPECLPSKLLWNSLNTAGIIEDKRRSTKQPLNNNLPVPMRNEDGNQSVLANPVSALIEEDSPSIWALTFRTSNDIGMVRTESSTGEDMREDASTALFSRPGLYCISNLYHQFCYPPLKLCRYYALFQEILQAPLISAENEVLTNK